jgi:hypothetical protein
MTLIPGQPPEERAAVRLAHAQQRVLAKDRMSAVDLVKPVVVVEAAAQRRVDGERTFPEDVNDGDPGYL